MLPAVLDERSKALLREFGQINGNQVRAGVTPSAGRPAADAVADAGNAGAEESGS
jgi:hypothetical protein